MCGDILYIYIYIIIKCRDIYHKEGVYCYNIAGEGATLAQQSKMYTLNKNLKHTLGTISTLKWKMLPQNEKQKTMNAAIPTAKACKLFIHKSQTNLNIEKRMKIRKDRSPL